MNKDKIIKEYEKSAGYRICYWCNKPIERGERILFSEEFNRNVKYGSKFGIKVIGACCKKCFNKYNKEVKGR